MSETAAPNSPIPKVLFFLVGLILGGAAASGGFLVYNQQKQSAFEAQIADLEAKLAAKLPGDPGKLLNAALGQVGNFGGLIPNVNLPGAPQPAAPAVPLVVSDEIKVDELGKGFIADLESNRVLSAYKTMSDDYQKKTERKDFDALIAKFPGLRRMNSSSYPREQKIRKHNDKSWEFYFTGRDAQGAFGKNLVNLALTISKDGDEWRINELEITAEK